MNKIFESRQFRAKLDQLAGDNELLKMLDKKVKDTKEEVKKLMISHSQEIIETPNLKLTCKEAIKTSFDEELAIKIISTQMANDVDNTEDLTKELRKCLQTKIVLDVDKLEKLIYDGIVPATLFERCVQEDPYFTLRLGKPSKPKK